MGLPSTSTTVASGTVRVVTSSCPPLSVDWRIRSEAASARSCGLAPNTEARIQKMRRLATLSSAGPLATCGGTAVAAGAACVSASASRPAAQTARSAAPANDDNLRRIKTSPSSSFSAVPPSHQLCLQAA